MRYKNTVPLTVYVYHNQRGQLEELQNKIVEDYQVKLSLSELVRMSLERGIPFLLEDIDFILERIG